MIEAIEQLLDEIRLNFHVAADAASRLHVGERVTTAQRAVLEYLVRHGDATVPSIARGRSVSRQHVQVLVNALVELELVQLTENPAHRRSPLCRLTASGEATIRRMQRRERAAISQHCSAIRESDVARASELLRELRLSLAEVEA